MKKHLPPVSFRATPDERKRIKMDARLAGMSMGSYIRSRLLEQPQTAA
ncbi:plasmid mobilization protein, partial [Klebsiella pneumoniae]